MLTQEHMGRRFLRSHPRLGGVLERFECLVRIEGNLSWYGHVQAVEAEPQNADRIQVLGLLASSGCCVTR